MTPVRVEPRVNAERLARQRGTVLIRRAKRASFEPLAQHPVLGLTVLNNDKLMTADQPASQKYDDGDW